MRPLIVNDYWRTVMYERLGESLANLSIEGTGVEFGGSNGVIQSMFPRVQWETRKYPPYDVTSDKSYERDWDVIVADQVLEHTRQPWEGIRLIGEHTKQVAVVTVPFLIGVHMRSRDWWRMTPRTLQELAQPHFSHVEIGSWGSAEVAYWHAIYNRTSRLLANMPSELLEMGLAKNDVNKPFVIWAVLKK